MRWRTLFLSVIFSSKLFCIPFFSPGEDTVPHKKTRKIIFASASLAVTAGSLVYLDQQWYKPYGTGRFHLFNDNGEWLQMDKAGHSFTTYNAGRLMMSSMKWAGFSRTQSVFIGGGSGFLYMTAIEMLDGFSSGWGFSWGDMGANFCGAALAISQEYFWKEQRITMKYSFHQTRYAAYRPSLLGSGLAQEALKDYNGQTIWLSVNMASFLKKENEFPKWLNVAFGYSASGMISAENNYVVVNADRTVIGNERYRKLLLSIDVDLTKIKTRSSFLRGLFAALNCVKIPFPALEFSKGRIGGHALYF
jgi:hypothetical protein